MKCLFIGPKEGSASVCSLNMGHYIPVRSFVTLWNKQLNASNMQSCQKKGRGTNLVSEYSKAGDSAEVGMGLCSVSHVSTGSSEDNGPETLLQPCQESPRSLLPNRK